MSMSEWKDMKLGSICEIFALAYTTTDRMTLEHELL